MSGGNHLEVSVDEGMCMGAGECVFRAPHTFALDERSKSRVVAVDGDSEAIVVAAAQSCPNFAISVVRDGERLV